MLVVQDGKTLDHQLMEHLLDLHIQYQVLLQLLVAMIITEIPLLMMLGL